MQANEFVRPGFELGFKDGDKYYIQNHLQFNILVHPTHGEYMRARQGYKDAAVLDNANARKLLLNRDQVLAAGASEEVLAEDVAAAGRSLKADAAAPASECTQRITVCPARINSLCHWHLCYVIWAKFLHHALKQCKLAGGTHSSQKVD